MRNGTDKEKNNKHEFAPTQFKSGIQCGACGQVIISTYVHDFNYCKCGETFVDGGDYYIRCGYGKHGYKHVNIDMINREIYLQMEDGSHCGVPWNRLYNHYYPLDGQSRPLSEEEKKERAATHAKLMQQIFPWRMGSTSGDRWPY